MYNTGFMVILFCLCFLINATVKTQTLFDRGVLVEWCFLCRAL